jgi:hypothetical protein
LYISGYNLNTIVKVDNDAKISGSVCRFFGTGSFSFIMTENVNFTTEGMYIVVGDFFSPEEWPELVILDVDLPEGMNGRLSAPNVTFIQRDWPFSYGDQWGTTSIDEPLLDIEIYHATSVWANLRL